MINDKKKTKGMLIYKLEIAIDDENNSIEYIMETLDRDEDEVSMSVVLSDSLEYFDKEGLRLIEDCYDIAES